MTTFGETLRRRRKELRLTIREMSKQSGLSESSLSQWERGYCLPSDLKLSAVAAAYRFDEMELVNLPLRDQKTISDVIERLDRIETLLTQNSGEDR